MSVEFSNAYQEILLDNLMSIIKQNFIFQTQLKLVENVSQQKNELQVKYDELAASFNSLKSKLDELEKFKTVSQINESVNQEKQRIQTALNNSMKENVVLKKQLEEIGLETNKLKEYITKLEEIAPVSKLKKINNVKVEEPAPDIPITIPNDGSSF
jgi:chromosome segregation ATPase